MEFSILGATTLTVKGHGVVLGVAKQRGLLAVLLFHVRKPVPVATIVEHLWSDRPVEECRPLLYALASRTRRALETVGLRKALVTVSSTGAYQLNVDPDSVDYHRFRRMVGRAREVATRGQHDRSSAILQQAIDLWRDEPLADLHAPRADQLRRHMKDTLLTAHKLLADSQLRIGQHEAVLARLEPLMDLHDTDETLARNWISALNAAGRADDARDFATKFRRRFRRQLHTEPAIDLVPPHPVRGGRQPADPPAPIQAPQQLPNDIPDFCGQAELLTELDALTVEQESGTTAVIVAGMPGAGKTTLATHWAHRHRHRFPDGQLYLNADAYGPTPPVRPDEALGRFLLALGVPPDRIPSGEEQRRERFNQLLSDKRILIILDNVLSSDQARPLIPASSGCVTIITSRIRLRRLTIRDGLRSITVEPLVENEGLDLLRQVIGPTRADGEPVAVQALVGLSGGLPLALRIIGEHVAERPRAKIADLVDELNAHLLDYEGEEVENPTLRTVLAWSYNALDDETARLFRLLGLYPGRIISSAAAGALLGADEQHAERLLNTLARAHLVTHDAARRYGLHDVLRRYAADQLSQETSPDDGRAALGRLLTWYLLSAVDAARVVAPERKSVPDLPIAMETTPLSFATDTAAMAWCEAERSNLIALVRSAAEHGFSRLAWQIPGAIHDLFGRYGRQDDVLAVHQIAVAAATLDGHEVGQIGSCNNLGGTYFAMHDYPRAAAMFDAGLQRARQIGDARAEATCLHNLASFHFRAGDARTAIPLYETALSMWTDASDVASQAATLNGLGDAFRRLDQHDESARHYEEALEIVQRIGSPRGRASTLGKLAALYLDLRFAQRALDHCAMALRVYDEVTDERSRCDVLITAADAQRQMGMYPEAVDYVHEAIAIVDSIADSLRRAHALAVLVDILVASGDAEAAGRHRVAALAIVRDLTVPGADAIRERLLGAA
jgi:tetratricopeptide (TPR) repeat protein